MNVKMLSNIFKVILLLEFRTYLVYFCWYLLIMVATGSRVVSGLKCFCNPRECDIIRSQDCPGKGLVVWDPCKCCKMCARILGEACGGPGGFSGTCEPPLQCVATLPITTGLGVCRDLPNPSLLLSSSPSSKILSSSYSTYLNCTKNQTIVIEEGCEITNKRCQCWPKLRVCKGDRPSDIRWHFKTLEDCQLNLQNLIKIEMDFDEDFTVSPRSFNYRKTRGKRRFLRKRSVRL